MNLDGNDKVNILLLSFLFIIVLILTVYISSTRNSLPLDNIEVKNSSFNFKPINTSNNECISCGKYNISEIINEKIESSGLSKFLNMQNEIQKPSLSNIPNLSFSDKCTPLFPFTDSIKYSKKYKYSLPYNNTFYVNDKFKGMLNNLYLIESTSQIMFSSQVYTSYTNTYYNNEGECIYSEFSNDLSGTYKNVECSNGYETFLCEEILELLEYRGEEKYYIYEKNYDVLVYSNSDNSTIIKYGKNVPVLFYMEKFENANKYLKIELLNLEG